MKSYWSIPGPSQAPQSQCVAFDKLDGSNLRFEWHRKRGWSKFGTRHRLFDSTDPDFGSAIDIFMRSYAEGIERVCRDNKDYRSVQEIVAFCEFFGPSSFAGLHDPNEPKTLVLFDLNVHKRGFVLPRNFIKDFGHLGVPDVVFEGNFGPQLVDAVKSGKINVSCEGVVCKGILHGKRKSDQHGLWMAKIKTRNWIEKLRNLAAADVRYQQTMIENLKEQGLIDDKQDCRQLD
jgi:hypothetical protein